MSSDINRLGYDNLDRDAPKDLLQRLRDMLEEDGTSPDIVDLLTFTRYKKISPMDRLVAEKLTIFLVNVSEGRENLLYLTPRNCRVMKRVLEDVLNYIIKHPISS